MKPKNLKQIILVIAITFLGLIISFSCKEVDETSNADDNYNKYSATSTGLVLISGGTFQMGDSAGGGDSDELPVHSVSVSSFYISDHEVTAAEYKECVDDGGCTYSGGTGSYYTYGASGKENHPLNYVSWTETQSYISWLNGQTSGNYRLCTEAEWEFAARAGTTTKYSCGDSDSCLNSVAWWSGNNSPAGTKAVKTKTANPWGLYDMHGNVWEWTQDWYHSSYSGAPTDGSAWESPTGSDRVILGGSFIDSASYLRSADRAYGSPGARHSRIGFRLCTVP
ncbi:MAG: formylglycine-generating enzyme family protein [Deltaproteobacteria bacterium]|mgnify:CR=1 FL=1|jgi:formylglycine-generating enzyme required for sulfatase activity|nr:formylglycine-generating enzyme family protein [Deltaproteobacteria bacterium]